MEGRLIAGASPQTLWRPAICAAVGTLLTVAVCAAALTPPAVGIADRFLAFAAILAIATVLTAVITSPTRLERAPRLTAIVVLFASAGGWYGGHVWVHEKQFDYLVDSQRTGLRLTALELSAHISNFLRERARLAPPPPMKATWQHDVDAVLGFDATTATVYEQRFGPQVRRTCELFALEGLRDPDLVLFYRHPASAFQINIVAQKLAVLARRLERTDATRR